MLFQDVVKFQIIEMPVDCPVGLMSCWPNVLSAKCLSAKAPVSQTSVGEKSCRSNVRRPNVRSRKTAPQKLLEKKKQFSLEVFRDLLIFLNF
jgi:hypothetical protein